jgi:defect-in-organelle-trafficking protein DotB
VLTADPSLVRALSLQPAFSKQEFVAFIFDVYRMGASDIKIQSGDFVFAEVNRLWRPVTQRRLERQEVDQALTYLTDMSSLGLIGSGEAVDARAELSYRPEGAHAAMTVEFRLNATGCFVAGVREGLSLTMRAIPGDIPSLEVMGIEQEICESFFPRYGLILVVGTTGSGKSTLIASALRHRLVSRRDDPVAIGTYEQPIEYGLNGLAQGTMPEPSQVDIGRGRHLKGFDQVGPNAMRRRFDVIVMGEVRDAESANVACELARTGHAVMATLHVETPGEAFDRLIKFYPYEQQLSQAHGLLAQMRMIVAQKIARTTNGGKMAFRSWFILDRLAKAEMAKQDPPRWASYVSSAVAQAGADFESAAYRALSQGLITGSVFCEVAGLTRPEARAYVDERGGDVAVLG